MQVTSFKECHLSHSITPIVIIQLCSCDTLKKPITTLWASVARCWLVSFNRVLSLTFAWNAWWRHSWLVLLCPEILSCDKLKALFLPEWESQLVEHLRLPGAVLTVYPPSTQDESGAILVTGSWKSFLLILPHSVSFTQTIKFLLTLEGTWLKDVGSRRWGPLGAGIMWALLNYCLLAEAIMRWYLWSSAWVPFYFSWIIWQCFCKTILIGTTMWLLIKFEAY